MKIAITIVVKENESIWKNGIIQNCIYAYDTFSNISSIESVVFLQMSHPSQVDLSKVYFLEGYEYDYWYDSNLEKIQNEFDVIVTLGGIPPKEYVEHFKQNTNNKLVAYKGGNEIIAKIEGIIYGNVAGWPNLLNNKIISSKPLALYDEVWMVPQQEFHNKDFFEIQYSCKSRSVPFLWDSKFVDRRALEIDQEGLCLFDNKEFDTWNFVCFEPNMSILKNMIPPIYIAEHAYSKLNNKDKLNAFMFTNAAGLKDNKSLISIVKDLSIYKEKKIFFEARYSMVDMLHKHTHGVISHQWGNPLNYAYLDACHLGYPLIHNASLCKDIGYYYEDWNLKQASDLLIDVIQNHKQDKNYMLNQREILKRYSPNRKDVIDQYEMLFNNLFNKNRIDEMRYNWKTNLLEK